MERGHLDRTSLAVIRRCLAGLEVTLDLAPRWRGAELARLLDESHASIQAAWKPRLENWGWQVTVEQSFNVYGDRGRMDLLAWHPIHRLLLVVEVKTVIADAQALLGGLNVKVRVARDVARSLGIGGVTDVVPVLLVAESSTNRARIRRVLPLFERFTLRGRQAMSWLRRPHEEVSGLLIFTDLRFATSRSVTRAAAHRIRLPQAGASVTKHRGQSPKATGVT